MLENIRFGLCAGCMFLGIFFEFSAVLGVFRFKYALNRLHAAALGDTMGLFLTILGLVIASGPSFFSLKLFLIVPLFWVASPVSSHMIARLEFETYEELSKEVDVWKH